MSDSAASSSAGASTEMPPPASTEVMSKAEKVSIEKAQEEKLRSKYPQGPGGRPIPGGGAIGGGAGGGGHSAFLQKRLAKGQKYFDSGDYQMAKQKPAGGRGMGGVGAAGNRLIMPVLAQPPTGDTIPTPELVPQRKTSIIQPLHDHSQSMHLISDPAHSASGAPSSGPSGLLNPTLAHLSS